MSDDKPTDHTKIIARSLLSWLNKAAADEAGLNGFRQPADMAIIEGVWALIEATFVQYRYKDVTITPEYARMWRETQHNIRVATLLGPKGS